ncbi:PP2C family protein-serine/threonine phosphatase [Sulfobacillus thermosulfidooxidans]|uniref:PP2C family protein-serine/threonine phosphatase n=1 Tax=Sulfobacillus thermosulfidooxidans TaxID=28034 RepID=UPI00096B77CF|nr:SpoIIE family protein phosphatase [Sulfobacillus thermosulfidooxidans]OLZ08612.1 stage II sporulation protein E [Sulfobacillus thermosulfidooxidans]OLZ13215.1 stage II sporulation protein E [Sulfobacillus thermosulfidooxidans]OLZ21595.1 stage II sporulation protein E [Sulfobacillus thermosulfidooxidans]
MRIDVAWAKIPKGGFGESGDTIELVERPLGGISLILADGQGSGPAAKRISRLVSMKAVSLIADGSRDGAVARAVQDMLYTAREGRVTATLVVLSCDMHTNTVVIARNTPVPVLIRQENVVFRLEGGSEVIGTYRKTRPAMTELPLIPDTILLTFSDGVINAGKRFGKSLPWDMIEQELKSLEVKDLEEWVNDLMTRTLALDKDRPSDDVSIVALGIRSDVQNAIRTLSASIPY